MPYIGNTTTSFNVDSNNINNGSITTEKIAAGAVVNADVNDSASIAGTKISADFGAQNLVVDTSLLFVDATNDRVGVGTTSPGRLLDVNGAAKIQNSTSGRYFEFINDSQNSYLDVSHGLQIRTNGGSSLANAVFIDTSQRVGIGTTSPGERLVVSGGGLQVTGFLSTLDRPSSSVMDFLSGATRFFSIGADSSTHGQFVFHTSTTTSNSERARIDSSGRLLVGTSSSSADVRALLQGNTNGSAGILTISSSINNPADGASLGIVQFADSGHARSAVIWGQRDGGTWTSGSSQPSRLVFSTTADAAASPTERLRIAQSGAFGLSGANYGTSGQVLTSQGSGSAPQWADAGGGITWLAPQETTSGSAITITGIDTDAAMIVISLYRVSQTATSTNQLVLQVGNGSIDTSNSYFWSVGRGVSANSITSANNAYRLLVSAYSDPAFIYSGNIILLRTRDASNPRWTFSHNLTENGGGNEPIYGAGSYSNASGLIDRVQLVPAGNFDNGSFRVGYIL